MIKQLSFYNHILTMFLIGTYLVPVAFSCLIAQAPLVCDP